MQCARATTTQVEDGNSAVSGELDAFKIEEERWRIRREVYNGVNELGYGSCSVNNTV